MIRALAHLLLVAAILATAPAVADEAEHEHEHGHDRARRDVLAGEIMPLSAILDRIAADQPGELVEAELERHHGRTVYEIRLLTPDGRLLKLYYDARDGVPLPGGLRR